MAKNSSISLAVALAAAFSTTAFAADAGNAKRLESTDTFQVTAEQIMQIQAEFSTEEMIAGIFSCSQNCNQHNHNSNHNHNGSHNHNSNHNHNHNNDEKKEKIASLGSLGRETFAV